MATLTYEDDFGEVYKVPLPLKTIIEQRVFQNPLDLKEEKASFMTRNIWLLPAGGIVLMFLVIAIILGMKRSRQRQKDEAKL